MQKLSIFVLGKILNYSDNCCIAGVSKSFIIALAKCNGETSAYRALNLIKIIRYVAVTGKIRLLKLFHSQSNIFDKYGISSQKIVEEINRYRKNFVLDKLFTFENQEEK